MDVRRPDGRETWSRLLEWDKGQTPSERLATTLLANEGYTAVDPSHPLGGKDGCIDARMKKDGLTLVLAVYFPRSQQSFNAIQKKFKADFAGVKKNRATGFVFFTNQELLISERTKLQLLAGEVPIDLYHLERVTTLLNTPSNYGIRLEFLQIAMTSEEIIALYAQRDKDHLEQLTSVTKALQAATEQIISHQTCGDSYLSFHLRYNQETQQIDVSAYIEGCNPNTPGEYSLLSVKIDIYSDYNKLVHQFSGQDVHVGIVNEFPSLPLPVDGEFKACAIKVFARNGHYVQYFMVKKYINNMWYVHSFRFNDLYYDELRQEEFDWDYPDQLKLASPSEMDYRLQLNIPDQVQVKSIKEIRSSYGVRRQYYGI
jgi:hypothetical protein